MQNNKLIYFFVVALTLTLPLNLHRPENFTIKGNRSITEDLVLSSGLISPGNSPGVITVIGNFSMLSGATYKCELKDLMGPGSGHDQINVSGDVTLHGTLDIVLDGYIPTENDAFEIITYGGSLSGSFVTVTGMPAGWQIDYGVITANTVTLYGPTSPLPVNLISFNARKKDDDIVITWQTGSEQNSDFFDIEHSTNGKFFTSLDRVKTQGNSSTPVVYTYVDKKPVKGINYYRLRQVDTDRKYEYSHIVSVNIEKQAISFYPNPSRGTINFSHPIESVVIFDMLGKKILSKENIESMLNISELNKGMYLIDINNGSIQQKLIVE